MNFPSVLCILAAVVGVMVAILGLGFGSAPGWGRYRALAGVGLTAAVYGSLDALWTSDVSTEVRFALAGAQGAVTALQVIAWQSYVSAHLRLPKTSFDRAGTVALAVIAALWLVPGLMVSDALAVVLVPAVGVTYRLPGSTLAGSAAGAVESLFLGLQLFRYVRARRDNPDAWTHILALGAIFVCGVNDSLVWCERLRSPLLLSLGFLVAVAALGSSLTRAFVASARQLDHLSRSLERLVAERTEALVAAEAALFRTEKMAALGQLAAGVAHEINNPAAAIEANLAYLRDAIDAGQLPTDARECVDESLQAIARIARIVLQMLDSGRAAARARSGNESSSVRAAVDEALASARLHLRESVLTSIFVPETLHVRANGSSLAQVLVNLVANAAQAIPVARERGHVQIRTKVVGERVHIEVIDDGSGMSAETQRRIFEPFFTTKALGAGTGLGLSVSLGLLRAMGGDLQVVSSSAGTTMTIILDAAEREPVSASRIAATRRAFPRRDLG